MRISTGLAAALTLWLWCDVALAEDAVETGVVLVEGIYFVGPAGEDVRVEPGDYRVSVSGDVVTLTPEAGGGEPLRIQASRQPHEVEVEEMVVMIIPDAGDVSFLTVLQPGGSGLQATGSASGVGTRGWPALSQSQVRRSYKRAHAVRQTGAVSPEEMSQEARDAIAEAEMQRQRKAAELAAQKAEEQARIQRCINEAARGHDRCDDACSATAVAVCKTALCVPACAAWGPCVRKCVAKCRPPHEAPCRAGCDSTFHPMARACEAL